MKTTIKNVSIIDAYGSKYYVIRYLKGTEKHVYRTAEVPKTVYRFIAAAPYSFKYIDRETDWQELRYSIIPMDFPRF